MTTTFYNVTITIEADSPKAAYTKLCNALATTDSDWTTDTYGFSDLIDGHSTSELFPTEEEIESLQDGE